MIQLILDEESNQYQLSDHVYIAKICRRNHESVRDFIRHQRNEVNLFGKVYGFSDVIIINDGNKAYQILKKVTGIQIDKLNYDSFNNSDISHLIIQAFYSLVSLHEKNIYHNDIKAENALYDQKQKTVYYIDFGKSVIHREGEVSDKDCNDFMNLVRGILFQYFMANENNITETLDGDGKRKFRILLRKKLALLTNELLQLDDIKLMLVKTGSPQLIKEEMDQFANILNLFLNSLLPTEEKKLFLTPDIRY